jgi:iron complex transport system ATP-binding protein
MEPGDYFSRPTFLRQPASGLPPLRPVRRPLFLQFSPPARFVAWHFGSNTHLPFGPPGTMVTAIQIMSASMLLDLCNVSVQRGSRVALDRLNLQVRAGEHVAILGPNGSGKSTLIKTITRECYPLLRPDSHLRILGKDAWNIFELRSQVGVVSNDLMATCTRDITGRELVLSGFFGSIGIPAHHEPTVEMEERALQVMKSLETAHLANRWLDELSSGEARRLLIARALIHGPSTLLLDEPTTSLDLSALHELRDYMRGLAQSGIGLLLVTHHLDDIIPEIDRVVLLKDGRLYADGPKHHVLQAKALSALFGTPVEIHQRDGFYHAW